MERWSIWSGQICEISRVAPGAPANGKKCWSTQKYPQKWRFYINFATSLTDVYKSAPAKFY
jgi:hypothetical protein